MTEENYLYRTSPLTLRSQFSGSGHWKIPVIPKAHFTDNEFQALREMRDCIAQGLHLVP